MATTVHSNAKLSSCTGTFPGHFCSIKVYRRRTIAFTTNLTTRKVHPFITVSSAFTRETISSIFRSITVRGLPMALYLSHTKTMNTSNIARRKLCSVPVLQPLPGLIVTRPHSRRVVRTLVRLSLGVDAPFIVECPHNTIAHRLYGASRPLSCKETSVMHGPGNGKREEV